MKAFLVTVNHNKTLIVRNRRSNRNEVERRLYILLKEEYEKRKQLRTSKDQSSGRRDELANKTDVNSKTDTEKFHLDLNQNIVAPITEYPTKRNASPIVEDDSLVNEKTSPHVENLSQISERKSLVGENLSQSVENVSQITRQTQHAKPYVEFDWLANEKLFPVGENVSRVAEQTSLILENLEPSSLAEGHSSHREVRNYFSERNSIAINSQDSTAENKIHFLRYAANNEVHVLEPVFRNIKPSKVQLYSDSIDWQVNSNPTIRSKDYGEPWPKMGELLFDEPLRGACDPRRLKERYSRDDEARRERQRGFDEPWRERERGYGEPRRERQRSDDELGRRLERGFDESGYERERGFEKPRRELQRGDDELEHELERSFDESGYEKPRRELQSGDDELERELERGFDESGYERERCYEKPRRELQRDDDELEHSFDESGYEKERGYEKPRRELQRDDDELERGLECGFDESGDERERGYNEPRRERHRNDDEPGRSFDEFERERERSYDELRCRRQRGKDENQQRRDQISYETEKLREDGFEEVKEKHEPPYRSYDEVVSQRGQGEQGEWYDEQPEYELNYRYSSTDSEPETGHRRAKRRKKTKTSKDRSGSQESRHSSSSNQAARNNFTRMTTGAQNEDPKIIFNFSTRSRFHSKLTQFDEDNFNGLKSRAQCSPNSSLEKYYDPNDRDGSRQSSEITHSVDHHRLFINTSKPKRKRRRRGNWLSCSQKSDVNVDKASVERMGDLPYTYLRNLSRKHPVCMLMEIASKFNLSLPEFSILPDNKQCYKVRFLGEDFESPLYCQNNIRYSKYLAAQFCLRKLGLESKFEIPVSYKVNKISTRQLPVQSSFLNSKRSCFFRY